MATKVDIVLCIAGGAAAGWLACSYMRDSTWWKASEEIQRVAQANAKNTEALNANFAAAGKGVVAVDIMGKKCFINARDGLVNSTVSMICLPR